MASISQRCNDCGGSLRGQEMERTCSLFSGVILEAVMMETLYAEPHKRIITAMFEIIQMSPKTRAGYYNLCHFQEVSSRLQNLSKVFTVHHFDKSRPLSPYACSRNRLHCCLASHDACESFHKASQGVHCLGSSPGPSYYLRHTPSNDGGGYRA